MRILVTGASGFIGGRFARFALEQGLSVRINGRQADAVAGLIGAGIVFWCMQAQMMSRGSSYRPELFMSSLQMIKAHPWLGLGLDPPHF